MSIRYTRRRFLSTLAAGTTVAAALPHSIAADTDDENRFSFLLLGDTHYDRIEHHDLAWMREHYPADIEQVESYCRHTSEVLPGILQAAKRRLNTAKARGAFALHVGDLIEGICGNIQLATRHCQEGWKFFQEAQLAVPLLMTKGNHDITGPGAIAAYNNILLPETAAELGREKLDRTSYSFRQGDNLFVIFDAYDATAIDWLEKVVAENEFERLFVLLHLPVVPYNARSSWRVYHHPRQADRRQRLLDLLGRHRAIVLSGHLHKYCAVARRCRTGKFVQLAVSSVLKDTVKAREPTHASIADYGPVLTEMEPDFSPGTLEARQTILAAEKPWIDHFEYAHISGYAVISINGSEVQAEIYNGIEDTPWKQISLSGLLA